MKLKISDIILILNREKVTLEYCNKLKPKKQIELLDSLIHTFEMIESRNEFLINYVPKTEEEIRKTMMEHFKKEE